LSISSGRAPAIAALRKALGPFGLDRDPERWEHIEPLFRKCAERYIFIQENQEQLPRPSAVAGQLGNLASAAKTLAAALEDLNSIALALLLATEEPADRRSLARVDFDALEPLRRLRDRVFWSELETVDRSSPALGNPRPQDPDFVIERIIAAQKALIRWRNLAKRNPTSSAIKKGLEKAELRYAVALAARREPDLPSPDPVRRQAVRRNRDLAALALRARRAFSSSAPQDSGGPSPLFGAPTNALARDCANVVLICFGLPGIKHVVSTKEGKFHKLLIAVHRYAMGTEERTPDFSGALKGIANWRKDRLAKLPAERFPDNEAIEEQITLLEVSLRHGKKAPGKSSSRRGGH